MKKKSILFINQSAGYLMIDIINAHVPLYDNLVLLTGFLNPRETDLDEKVKVNKLLEYKRSSSLERLMTWLGFWFQTLYFVFVKYRSHKVYFVSNPPLNVFTAKWIKRDFAFLVYDIYPDALTKNNIISDQSLLFKYWEKSNQTVYKKAKRMFTLSHGMKNAMKVPEYEENKLDVVPVWTNNTFFKDIKPQNNEFIKKYDLHNKFVISYSGNLGKTHPVEKIIELAQKLVDEHEISFLIIGNGDKKDQLLKMQEKVLLPNLKILDFQSTALFPHVLASVNIGVVTLESDAGDLSVPSKTFNLMSAGKPILSIANESSELAKIVKTNKIGENFSENEIDKMCDFIVKLKSNPDKYQEMQIASKKTSLLFSPDNAKKMILN
jgi:glycosyltransferase involved in cell wall biosynthesis